MDNYIILVWVNDRWTQAAFSNQNNDTIEEFKTQALAVEQSKRLHEDLTPMVVSKTVGKQIIGEAEWNDMENSI